MEFDGLKVTGFVGRDKLGKSLWTCVCKHCGKDVTRRSDVLQKVDSCGCLQGNRKHGHKTARPSPEYNAWTGMIRRCHRSTDKKWKDYGGRGIVVCKEWRKSFESFLAYAGLRPTENHSLDRWPNNDGNYEPGNVRWATKSEQAKNRRKWCAIQNFPDDMIRAEFIRRKLTI